ncbi:MAG: diaminopimelate decarboxylase [Candidatus Omnitrophica bacterium]|nr:diaminopimelate decarboxylase [Candidatus Omnitrophota bacterium]
MEEGAEVIFDGFFGYRKGIFYAEGESANDIAAKYGTPCYVYSRNSLLSRIKSFKSAFSAVNSLICYSVKANSNRSILRLMKESGLGADVVSGGELRRALLAGFTPGRIVFAGVGKKDDEIELGIKKKIYCFNIENEEEIGLIEKHARRYRRKNVLCSLRLNLDIDVDTHHYVKTSKKETKFGLDVIAAAGIIKKNLRSPYISIKGLHLHLGSQLKDASPYLKALAKVRSFSEDTGFNPEIIDIGGGFGINYSEWDAVKKIEDFGIPITEQVKKIGVKKLILEPGRYIVGNTAVLLTRVLYVKKRPEKNFIITDAGMNDLIRPAFYGSHHGVFPVKKTDGAIKADIVGPICETGDYLARDAQAPENIKSGDLLAIGSAGAYCFSMSSNYNSRTRPCEVMVDGKKSFIIRKREAYGDLWRGEV